MNDRPPRAAPISVRLPELLRNRVADRATREERSFNGQIVWLLERGLAEPAGMPIDDGAPSREPQPEGGELEALAEPGGKGVAATEAEPGREAASETKAARVNIASSGPASARPFQPDFKVPAKKKERRR